MTLCNAPSKPMNMPKSHWLPLPSQITAVMTAVALLKGCPKNGNLGSEKSNLKYMKMIGVTQALNRLRMTSLRRMMSLVLR